MKIEEYGCFYLKHGNDKKALSFKNNFVSLHDGLCITETPIAGALISISISDFDISVMNLNQSICVNGIPQMTPLFSINENDLIKINDEKFKILFDATSIAKLNKLLDMFIDGTLPEYFDIQKMFLEYAKCKPITDKQAAFILASIDVPELDVST